MVTGNRLRSDFEKAAEDVRLMFDIEMADRRELHEVGALAHELPGVDDDPLGKPALELHVTQNAVSDVPAISPQKLSRPSHAPGWPNMSVSHEPSSTTNATTPLA